MNTMERPCTLKSTESKHAIHIINGTANHHLTALLIIDPSPLMQSKKNDSLKENYLASEKQNITPCVMVSLLASQLVCNSLQKRCLLA